VPAPARHHEATTVVGEYEARCALPLVLREHLGKRRDDGIGLV
jgi:hypothetical protein